MIVSGNDGIREVSGITSAEEQSILDFLQGAVYCWCKNQGNAQFSLSDFTGGANKDWSDTSLGVLYSKHTRQGKTHEEAFKQAGIDGGWLLKKVVLQDKREFLTVEGEEFPHVRKYYWKQEKQQKGNAD